MSEVILSAIPAAQRLAREQANLVIGHLTIVAEHWKHALNYELENLSLACALASNLSSLKLETALGDDLIAALAEAAAPDRSDYAAVKQRSKLGAGIIQLAARTPANAALFYRASIFSLSIRRATVR